MFSKYEGFSDEILVEKAKAGDVLAEEYLIRKFKEMVRGKANLYYIVGADTDDLMQEGMIGIFKAIRSYEGGKNASFSTFANLCINRQIITAIKAAGRLKHLPLNQSVSLSEKNEEEETFSEILISNSESDPEAILLLKEMLEVLSNEKGKLLSPMETKVMGEYLQGKSYGEIGALLDKSAKSVDNAVQRIRKKITAYIR